MLFGQQVNTNCSELRVNVKKLLPHQYFEINEHDGLERLISRELKYENKEGSNYREYSYIDECMKFIRIPERPANLFSDLQALAQLNNLTINIEYALSILPTEGPYPLYD